MLLEKDKLTGTFGNVSSLFFWTSSISSEKKHAKLVRKNKEIQESVSPKSAAYGMKKLS